MKIDQFQSRFKHAVKERYQYEELLLSKAALVSRRASSTAAEVKKHVNTLLPKKFDTLEWEVFAENELHSVQKLVTKLDEFKPDLIVTERNLENVDDTLVYGLSNYVDALTQVCEAPVLLLPDASPEDLRIRLRNCSDVMVETNHLTGDSRLINWAVSFVEESGTLFLTHIEDQRMFDYYLSAISKIAEIDTDIAETTIRQQLLSEPEDFISQAKEVLSKECPKISVEGLVRLGQSLEDYREMLNQHQIDLLVINTKKDGQLAMGGLAYAIAVEFKHIPLLML